MKSGAVEQVSSGTDLIHPPARLPPLRFRCLGRVAIPERVEVPRFIRAVGCKHDLNALAVPYRRSGSSGCRHGYKRWRERFSCRCARRQVAGVATATARAKAARAEKSEEEARLEALVHDASFRCEQLSKQLLISKHTPAPPKRRPLSAVLSGGSKKPASPWQQTLSSPERALSARGGGESFDGVTGDERQRLVAVLQGEFERAKERLRRADAEAKEAKLSARDARDRRYESKTVAELRTLLAEMSTSTQILASQEEHTAAQIKLEQEALHRAAATLEQLRAAVTEERSRTVEADREKKRLELRRAEHATQDSKTAELRAQLAALETENELLRHQAFSAGEVKLHARALDHSQEEERARQQVLAAELARLKAANAAKQSEAERLGLLGDDSSSALEQRIAKLDGREKQLARENASLSDKLATFVGHEGSGAGRMDQQAVREARLLAQRTGLPLYMRVVGGATGGEGDALRRELRRLRVGNAAELREIEKLQEMAGMQKSIAARRRASAEVVPRAVLQAQRAHAARVATLQKKIAEAAAKAARLREQLAQRNVAVAPAAPPRAGRAAGARPAVRTEDLSRGRGVVSVVLDRLVLAAPPAGAEEPVSMLLLDFFLHDTQHSLPLVGRAPDAALAREFEVAIDAELLAHLSRGALQVLLLSPPPPSY